MSILRASVTTKYTFYSASFHNKLIKRANNIPILITVTRQAILVVRRHAPRVIATKTTLGEVYVEYHLATRLNIGVVHLFLSAKTRVKILGTIGHSTHTQRLKTLNTYTNTIIICELQPSHIGLIARLLRTDIGEELLVGRLAIDAKE